MSINSIFIYLNERPTAKMILLFLLKLIVIFYIFDFFFLFLIGAPVEGGIYVPLLKKFNLAMMFRDMLLKGGGILVSLIGYDYYIANDRLIIEGGSGIILGYSCYGFSIISLFIALILSYPQKVEIKAFYFATGIFAIILLNIMRIGILAIIFSKEKMGEVRELDHHMIFNFIVYIVIFAIFYRFVNAGPSKMRIE